MPSLAKRSSAVVAFVVMTTAPFVTSQVALDDFVGFLHERAPSSWPHNAETSRPAVFWREGACRRGNRNGLDSLQRGSGAHGRNGRDPAVDQEVCPDDVRRIVRREVNCQLRDFQRIGHPLAWIVGSEDILNRLALLFAWKATEHRRVRRAWA